MVLFCLSSFCQYIVAVTDLNLAILKVHVPGETYSS